MRKLIICVLAAGVGIGLAIPSYASDWDKFGKAAAVIEGIRILTRGDVDIFGNILGINRQNKPKVYVEKPRYDIRKPGQRLECVWVPRTVWKKRYVVKVQECKHKNPRGRRRGRR